MKASVAKLLRGFCKITNQPYRVMKREYTRMKSEARRDAKIELVKFWEENEKQGLLDHKKYYDLKKPLSVPASDGKLYI